MAAIEKLLQLAGVALFLIPGAALVHLLPGWRDLPGGRRLAYAYLLGVASVAGSLYALSHAFAVPLRRPAILAVAAAPLLAWLALRRRRGAAGESRRPARRWTGLEAAAAVFSALVFLAVLADALTFPVRDWDGRMTWAAQARYLRAEGTVEPSVLTQPGWYVTHPWYPVLLPVAQAAVLELVDASDDEPLFRALYAAFFPAWLLVLYGGARRFVGRGAAALTALAAALLPVPSFYLEGGAVSAYSDLPLACFYGAGLLPLLKPRPKFSEGVAAGLLLGAAVLTKNEGGPLALWALVLSAFAARAPGGARALHRRWKPLALAAGIVAAALLLELSWRSGIPERFQSYRRVVSWSLLWPGVIDRIPMLLPRIFHEMSDWGIFWGVALLILLAGWRGLRRRAAPALLLAAAAPLGIAWLAYSISLEPLIIVRTSWNRFVLQASLPALVLFSLALNDLLRRASWLPSALGGPARSLSRRHDRDRDAS
jgi:hypothetical protein